MQTRSQKRKYQAKIAKKIFSPSNNFKKSKDSIETIKNNKLKGINITFSRKSSNKKISTKKRSSSLGYKRKRSRDKSIEKEKNFTKKNGNLKNIILNKNILKKNIISKKNQKNVKEEIPKEIDYYPNDYQSEEEEEKYDDEESIKSFSEMRLEYLPCRKEEQDIIYNYIKKGLQTNGNYNSLYIAGMPGTGKTASVKTIINILESELNDARKKNKNLSKSGIIPFKKLFISGMEYPNISNVFKLIYNFIFAKNKSYTVNKYIQLLDNFFSERKKYNSSSALNDPSNSHIVLIIDEIDILINYTQNLLYNIFNWTTYEYSKLIVISISNTLDLPNRLFPKIKSRMGNNKIMFKPYNKEELRIIIKDRGIDLQLFSEDALRLSCVKVAAINGDLRRIFQILARARQINELRRYKKKDNNNNNLVSKYDILDAWNELFNSKISNVIKSLQINEKIIIASLLSKTKDNNINKIKVGDLYDKIEIFLKKYNENNDGFNLSLSWEEFKNSIYNLMRIKLLSFYDIAKNNFLENNVVIKFYTDEFIMALEEDEEFKPVLDYLTQIINR